MKIVKIIIYTVIGLVFGAIAGFMLSFPISFIFIGQKGPIPFLVKMLKIGAVIGGIIGFFVGISQTEKKSSV